MNDSELLSLVRKHIPAAYRMVTLTRWKDGIDLDEPVFGLHSLVADILAAERAAVVEECAKVCDDAVCVYNSNEQDMLAKQCAFLIRKLGEKRE